MSRTRRHKNRAMQRNIKTYKYSTPNAIDDSELLFVWISSRYNLVFCWFFIFQMWLADEIWFAYYSSRILLLSGILTATLNRPNTKHSISNINRKYFVDFMQATTCECASDFHQCNMMCYITLYNRMSICLLMVEYRFISIRMRVQAPINPINTTASRQNQ